MYKRGGNFQQKPFQYSGVQKFKGSPEVYNKIKESVKQINTDTRPISGYVDLNPARRLGKINAPKITKNDTEISPEAAQKLADFQESLKK